MAEEVRSHLERAEEYHRASGVSPDEAPFAALRQFGGIEQIKERCRDGRNFMGFESLIQDLRYASRALRKHAGFSTVAVLIVALGIGANTAIFSLIDAVLLRSLPVARPSELAFLRMTAPNGRQGPPSYAYLERLPTTPAFASWSLFATDELKIKIAGEVEQVFGQHVSGSYFQLLGLSAIMGRLIAPDDEKQNDGAAVISHDYWLRRFGGSPSAIGRTVESGNRSFTIIGVTPPEFWGLEPGRKVDVTVLRAPRSTGTNGFGVVTRLAPGTTLAEASAQANASFQALRLESGPTAGPLPNVFDRVDVTPAAHGLDGLRQNFSKPIKVLTAGAGLVLLIACVNLSSLLLARGAIRTREFATRVALGAAPQRLVRQLLTETAVLFALGTAGGIFIAVVATSGLTGFFAAGRRPVLLDVHFNWQLAAFAGGIAAIAALLAGLWPALRALRTDPQAAIKAGDTRLAGSARVGGAGRSLITAQVALSLVLLVAAVMFVRTMANVRAVDLGFTNRHVLTMSLDPALADDMAREQFWRQALERVRSLPGVRAASLSVLSPLSGRSVSRPVAVVGATSADPTTQTIGLNHVSEDYFQTFGIPMHVGRTFTSRDTKEAQKVVVLNESAARAYFGGRDPTGASLTLGTSEPYQVIGVVRDHKHLNVREAPPPFAFVPLQQRLDRISRITLALSSDQAPATLARAVGREVRALQPDALVSDVITLDAQIDASLVSERLLSALVTAFTVLAVGLAAIGLYGLLSYSVARRSAEFGLRLALGGAPSRVTSDVVREMLLPVAGGIGIGLVLAGAAARLTDALLFGVTVYDPTSYLVAAMTLVIVAGFAAWLPARRAARVDPMVALRAE